MLSSVGSLVEQISNLTFEILRSPYSVPECQSKLEGYTIYMYKASSCFPVTVVTAPNPGHCYRLGLQRSATIELTTC